MTKIQTANLSAMQLGRLNAALDKQYRFSSGVMTMRQFIEGADAITKTDCDGMIDWSRTRFNRMSHAEQTAYEARLRAKRYYFVNDVTVPKIIYDAVSA